MAEVVKHVLNTLGITAILLGVLTNLNSWISIVVAMAGFAFGVAKAINEWHDAWPKVVAWYGKIKSWYKKPR